MKDRVQHVIYIIYHCCYCCSVTVYSYCPHFVLFFLQMPGGQAGMLEMKMLCLRGHKAPFSIHPETLHLPPLHQQRHSHSSLSARTNWPVTNKMLKNQAL